MALTLGITLVLTTLVGFSLGLLGSGGSIVMLPVLVYVAGFEPAVAVPLSLVVVGATSAVGAVLYHRRREVHLRSALLFAVSGAPGSWAGAALTRMVEPHILMLVFALLMAVVGSLMLRQSIAGPTPARACSPPRCLTAGAAVGVLTGFLGVGGGFLLIPTLIWFAAIEARAAIGTSLAVIALNAAAGLVGHARSGSVPWDEAANLSAAAVVGMLGGLGASLRMRSASLKRLFAWFVILTAVTVAVLNVPLLLS